MEEDPPHIKKIHQKAVDFREGRRRDGVTKEEFETFLNYVLSKETPAQQSAMLDSVVRKMLQIKDRDERKRDERKN